MKQPSLSDLLTKFDSFADSVAAKFATMQASVDALQPLHATFATVQASVASIPGLHRPVTSLQSLHGSVASLQESMAAVLASLGQVHRTLDQRSVALLEPTTDVRQILREHSVTLEEHSGALSRIEQNQRRRTRRR